MKKKTYLLIGLLGLIGIFSSCEKDGSTIKIASNPVAPQITSMPENLILQRANSSNSLTFRGSFVDPGFTASATYKLEAALSGTDFADPVTLFSGKQDTLIVFQVSDLNTLLLKKFDADVTSSVDFRITATLTVDAGTGAPGTSTDPFIYASETITKDVLPYGLPRLDVIVNSTVIGKIESALGNGEYEGYVKFTSGTSFTMKDPEANIVYGDNSGALSVDGAEIPVADEDGWHKIIVSTNDLTYEVKLFKVGVIGDATPNGWSSPDQKMDYSYKTGLWNITLDLKVGTIKFRVNDDWGGDINLGIGDADHPEYTVDNLWNNGSSQNIPIETAGNYIITLYIGTSSYYCTITKNE